MQRTRTGVFCDQIAPHLHTRGLLPGDADWSELRGGRTNKLWRVTHNERDIVIKLFSGRDENPLFPNEPTHEALALRHLEPYDIAPSFVDQIQIGGDSYLIYDYLPGNSWHSNTCQAAEFLYRLHQIEPPEGLRQVAEGSDVLRQQTRTILFASPHHRRENIIALEPDNPVPSVRNFCFLHGDPVPTNMILHAGELKMIDWQCPAIGDPCEDLAIFLSPAMQLTYRGEVLSEIEIADFLSAYPDKVVVERYLKLAPWYHWRMAAYCLWQECRGDPNAARAGAAEICALLRLSAQGARI